MKKILANSQTSKGQRRKRIQIEESALLNDELFQDALAPIVEVGRNTCGKLAIVDPLEMNQAISFFSTPGFRGSTEHIRSINMAKNMINLQGEILLGASWSLPCYYGRGSTKDKIIKKKREMTPVAFDQNYNSRWTGSFSGALININKLLKARILENAVIENGNKEIYIGVDVARSQDTTNNQTSIVVVEVVRNSRGRIKNIDAINLINISNALNFDAQAIEVKRAKKQYNAKAIACDSVGVGAGLIDALLREHKDPYTGEILPCLDTINTDLIPDKPNAERCVYEIKAQSNNTEVIVNFINMVEGGKLRLLQKKQNVDYDLNDKENYMENMLPFVQTDFLIEEIANLQLEHLNNGKLAIKKLVKRMNKDRFSALAYVLWYINEFEDYEIDDTDDYDFLSQYGLFM